VVLSVRIQRICRKGCGVF